MENGSFIDGLPNLKMLISIVMLVYQRVQLTTCKPKYLGIQFGQVVGEITESPN
jgi:hypothetical protein